MNIFEKSAKERPKIIVFEGISGAGKSTQSTLLASRLKNYFNSDFALTEWNSDPIVSETIKELKRIRDFQPLDNCLLHASDFYRRYYKYIVKASFPLVIFDRYFYTAFARDTYRGVPHSFLSTLYSYASQPDLVLYIDTPIEITLKRKKDAIENIYFYGNGQDIDSHLNSVESFTKYQTYQQKIYYDILLPLPYCVKIDGSSSVEDISNSVWRCINII